MTCIITFVPEDLTWLKHELAERHHEQRYNAGYDESHNRAEKRWTGEPWPEELKFNDIESGDDK